MKIALSLLCLVLLLETARADRAVVADSLAKLATAAQLVAKETKASDDRAIRRKFSRLAQELGDDLEALARRARKDVPLKTIAAELAELDRDALALIEAADDAEDKNDRKVLRQAASLVEQGVVVVRRSAEAAAAKENEKTAEPARPAAMAPANFARLVAAVKDATMDSDKVAVAQHAGASNWFSAAQIGTLMDLISFDSAKVDVAASLWARMVDPANSFTIFGHLDFDSSKEELRRRVGK